MSDRPIMIAVGGDSGAGKTTLCYGLEKIFGSARIQSIRLDDYHSLDRAQRKAVDLTALDPRASNFAAMEEDLWALREGRAIDKPVYDHRDGTFAAPEHVEPKEIVVVEGLFPLYTRTLRSLFDVRVWVDPEPELRTAWKIQRDTIERGYADADVHAELGRKIAEYERFVKPQANFADLTVSFFRPEGWSGDPSTLATRIRKGGRLRALDYAEFASASTSLKQMEVTSSGGFPETEIELGGSIDRATAESVEDRLWPHIASHRTTRPDRLGEFRDAQGATKTSYSLALAQLLIARRVVLIENELMEAV